jgi:predicted PurR-regulated permease PerM
MNVVDLLSLGTTIITSVVGGAWYLSEKMHKMDNERKDQIRNLKLNFQRAINDSEDKQKKKIQENFKKIEDLQKKVDNHSSNLLIHKGKVSHET